MRNVLFNNVFIFFLRCIYATQHYRVIVLLDLEMMTIIYFVRHILEKTYFSDISQWKQGATVYFLTVANSFSRQRFG